MGGGTIHCAPIAWVRAVQSGSRAFWRCRPLRALGCDYLVKLCQAVPWPYLIAVAVAQLAVVLANCFVRGSVVPGSFNMALAMARQLLPIVLELGATILAPVLIATVGVLLLNPPKKVPTEWFFELRRVIWSMTTAACAVALCLDLFLLWVLWGLDSRMLLRFLGLCGLVVVFLYAWRCWPGDRSELPPSRWPAVSQLCQDHPEYCRLVTTFTDHCSTWEQMFPFRLTIRTVYVLSSEKLECVFRDSLSKMNSKNRDLRRLYHGTSMSAAQRIALEGFALPMKSGMFGKGIYFAEAPQKSWRFATRKQTRHLIACDVAIGNVKPVRHAAPALDPSIDLRRSWLLRAFGAEDYDSLMAPARSHGGVVNVPEFVIYHPERALPRYLIELREEPRS